jgi:hypothetical protein
MSDAEAAGVPGTKERISFEGVVGRHEQSPLGDYDGFGWGNIEAIGKGLDRDEPGFQSVVHGKAAAANLQGTGIIGRDDNSRFTLKSGHFAAFGDGPVPVTFNAYLNGVLVGTLSMTLQPADTLVQFDRTFAHIDRFEIDGHIVAFDNLHVSF